jgi:cytochrome d ubiquinol oxidase subunit I
MDVVTLSRLQFGLTTAFHILFPTLTIGMAVYLVVIELLWLRTGREIYYRMYRFWVKIFAVHFAVGVVSGITLEFEFGTNFARFSEAVGNVLGPLFAYEGMTAFFLEAGFLGIMLFGWKRVPRGVHFLSTCLVAFGACLSGFWIMAANAWMQTPAGYIVENGKFMVTSFWEVIFNPSMPTHLVHMLLASYETASFAIAGISAFFILKKKNELFYRKSLGLALILAAVFAPLQVFFGDLKGKNVSHWQPAKLAAIEAHWETNTDGGASFLVFGIPDMDAEKNRFEIKIPYMLSLLTTHSLDGKVIGLKEFLPDERPNVLITFFTFRVMAGIGFVFLFVMIWAFFLWRKKRLFKSRAFLMTLVAIQPLGFIATITGWITAEMGRQPWIVYGEMMTRDAVSPIAPGNVVWSLIVFALFFGIIGAVYLYYIFKLLKSGPDFSSPIPSIHLPVGMKPFLNSNQERI